jgi:hypothetical protein
MQDSAKTQKQREEDHTKRVTELDDEMTKLNEKKTVEETTYSTLRQQYAETGIALAAFHGDYLTKMADLSTATEETAKSLKTSLDDIKNSISTVDAAVAGSTEIGQRTAARRATRQQAAGITPFADGGIVTRPTLALIGEAGPEAVVPLNKAGMGVNITIQSMAVREEADIQKIAGAIARIVQLQQLQSA